MSFNIKDVEMRSVLSGKPARLVTTFDAEKVANDWINAMHVDVGNQFRELGAIQLWECQETGLKFYAPASSAGEEYLYSQLETFDWYYMEDKWEFREALRILPDASNLLEVGVGNGHFLQAAKDKGHHCCGLELNSKAAKLRMISSSTLSGSTTPPSSACR